MKIFLFCSLVITFLVIPPMVEASCGLVPIEQWGGSPSSIIHVLQVPVDLVIVTHTVTSACTTDQDCERIANAIRNNQKAQGYTDIGLSFMIGENGKVYEGSGWRYGNHTRGYNHRSISLSFIGDFRTRLPSEPALMAAKNFLSCFLYWYVFSGYKLVGHRQLMATISPGDALQNVIQTWPHWVPDLEHRRDQGICGIIPLEYWGGSISDLRTLLKGPLDLVIIGHTVSNACTTDRECERIANIIRNDQKAQGYADIGWSFLIGENGKVYEGSGWRVGHHTRGYNDKSISLSFIGDFRTRAPSQSALMAAKNFLSCVRYWYVSGNYKLLGQRQLIPTVSPGDALQNVIQSWPHWVPDLNTRLN